MNSMKWKKSAPSNFIHVKHAQTHWTSSLADFPLQRNIERVSPFFCFVSKGSNQFETQLGFSRRLKANQALDILSEKKSSLPMERPGGTVVLLRAPRGWMLSHNQRTGTKLTFVQGSKAYEWSFQLDGTYGDRPPERKSHQMNEQILTLVQPLLLKVFLLFDRRTKTNKNFLTGKRTARNWQKTLMRFYSH